MPYTARLGILFVLTLFAIRVSAGINVDNHWYSFFFALFVAALNAFIRTVYRISQWKLGWLSLFLSAAILNIFLFWLLYLGAASWLGLTAKTFGTTLLAAGIVTLSSIICNHFIGFKRKDS